MAVVSATALARVSMSWVALPTLFAALSAAAPVRISISCADAEPAGGELGDGIGARFDVLGGFADLAAAPLPRHLRAPRCPARRPIRPAAISATAWARVSMSWVTLPTLPAAALGRGIGARLEFLRGLAEPAGGEFDGRVGAALDLAHRFVDPAAGERRRGIGARLDLLGHAADATREVLGRLGGACLDLLGDAADLAGEELARPGGARLDVMGDAADPGGEDLGRLGGADLDLLRDAAELTEQGLGRRGGARLDVAGDAAARVTRNSVAVVVRFSRSSAAASARPTRRFSNRVMRVSRLSAISLARAANEASAAPTLAASVLVRASPRVEMEEVMSPMRPSIATTTSWPPSATIRAMSVMWVWKFSLRLCERVSMTSWKRASRWSIELVISIALVETFSSKPSR